MLTVLTGLRVVLGLIGLGKWLARWQERREAKKAGATEQRLEDAETALEAKDEQLEEAVRRRPGDARKRLRDGSF